MSSSLVPRRRVGRRHTARFIAFPFLVIMHTLTGCTPEPSEFPNEPMVVQVSDEEQVLPVAVQPVREDSFAITVTGRGEVLPGAERALFAAFSSVVDSVEVETGTQVEAGDVIAQLSTRDLERSLAAARDRLLSAQKNIAAVRLDRPDLANRESDEITTLQEQLQRLDERYAAGEIGFAEYTERQTALRIDLITLGAYVGDFVEIESGIREAQRTVVELQQQIDAAVLKAPISGTVELADLYPGKPVRTGERLGTLFSFTPATALISLLEQDVLQVSRGNRAEVRLGVTQSITIPGTVTHILSERAPQGGFPVVISFDAPTVPVIKGMFAEATIVVDEVPDRLLVPVDALLRENENYYVFVISDGLAMWRWVEVGRRSGQYVEVEPDPFTPSGDAERIHGVDRGELVAVAGHTLLGHKGRVVIQDDEAQ
ncbi:MAG: efflux RND transporter periplasmic adaptor subunit [Spirochaetota bacterium]